MHSRRAARAVAIGALSASLAWLWLLLSAPAAADAGAPGRALSAWTYATGSRVCHQRPERSFAWGPRRLPVCARCLGLYLGVPLGLVLALAQQRPTGSEAGRRQTSSGRVEAMALPARAARVERAAGDGLRRTVIAAAAAATIGSVAAEWSGLADPGPLTRAGLGAVLGAALAWACVGALLDEAGAPGAVN
jgi:hypothetical protein